MSRSRYPVIQPVAAGTARPFWSVMIPTYNRTEYLGRAITSVLEQAPGADEMQIEVIDNASPDYDVEEFVREIGGDRVRFHRHQANVGLVSNWNACVQRAHGYWVHILHDDDMVRPDFYHHYRRWIEAQTAVSEESKARELGLVFSRSIAIDEDDEWRYITAGPRSIERAGVWHDGLFNLLSENPSDFLRCPSIVVARRAYETVGGFDEKAIYTHDWQMWLRIAAHFELDYLHEPLALYRQHPQGITYTLIREHDVLADIERTINIGLSLLPPQRRAEAKIGADRTCAQIAEMYRGYVRSLGYHRMELKYSRHLYRHEPSLRTLLTTFTSLARVLKTQLIKPSAAQP